MLSLLFKLNFLHRSVFARRPWPAAVVIDAANAVPIKKAQPAFMIVGFLAPRQSHLPGFRIKPDF
jgi:hypothetical protein